MAETGGKARLDASHVINRVAGFLSTATGFLITFVTLVVGIGIGAAVQFNDQFMFGFNIFLSVAAIVISGIILVSAARSEAALHVKLDRLIESSQASNKSIGLEHKDVQEIERERERAEAEALENAVEAEVSEHLAEARPSKL
jgi:low affinity Fe/Cu permease